MGKVCILLADGFEEIEAITTIDVLRRANIDVRILGVTGPDVRGAHQVRIHADALLRDADGFWDAVILPGGGAGAETLRDDLDVQTFLRAQAKKDGVVLAAICAAPMALAHAGLLEGKRATCYPGMEDQMGGADLCGDSVVIDGRIITSRGPSTATPFALALVERLVNRKVANEVGKQMLLDPAASPFEGSQPS